MKSFLLAVSMFIGQIVMANEAPANYPIVKGEVRKVDLASGRVSIKHEEIPNLNMPPMTMSFLVQDAGFLNGLVVGDKINFVADEVDGDLTVLWLEEQSASNLPLVKGVVKKIDLASSRVSIKHEAIPNLNMPAMTMSFLAQDPQLLEGLKVGDNINFTAEEIDGELTILSIEKVAAPNPQTANILCKGFANTSPKTNVEIEIRREKFSTIRYEFAEGSYKGTAYINSIGRMSFHERNGFLIARAGSGVHDSKLIYQVQDGKIINSCFTNFSAGMENSPVDCAFAQ